MNLKHKLLIPLSLFCAAGACIAALWLMGKSKPAPSASAAVHCIGPGKKLEVICRGTEGCKVTLADSDGNPAWTLWPVEDGEYKLNQDLPAGAYSLTLTDGQGQEISTETVTVTDSLLYTEEETYPLRSLSPLYYDPEAVTADGWIAIYHQGDVPGKDMSVVWLNLADQSTPDGMVSMRNMQGQWMLFGSVPGEYTAYLFADNNYQYDYLASWDFSTVESEGWMFCWLPESDKAGAAQGGITVRSPEETGKVSIYWGCGGEVLADYLPLAELTITEGAAYKQLPESLAIPAGATELLLCSANGKVLANERIPDMLCAKEETPLYSFAVISDTHVTPYPWNARNRQTAAAFADLAAMDLLLTIDNGDVTNNGRPREYALLKGMAQKTGLSPFYLTIGNHDVYKNLGSYTEYRDTFLKAAGRDSVYTELEVEAPATFLLLGSEGAADGQALDSGDSVLHEGQLSWLSAQLEAAPKNEPVFIFHHQPLSDSVSGTLGYSDVIPDSSLHELLDGNPQAFFISGHTHYTLGSEWAAYQYQDGLSVIHDGCVCESYDGEEVRRGSEGLVVEVYEDYLLLRARDFLEGAWMASGFRRLDFRF